MQHDLILKGARVIDPSQDHDGICDVAFAEGRVSGFGRDLQAGPGTQVRDMAGAIVTPTTLARAFAAGITPAESLARNDGHGFFEALGNSVVTGPTLTNVNDFRAILIE